jgi:Leucine-rich repeat (LRR) protein
VIVQLTNLQKLKISENIRILAFAIEELTTLTKLDLSCNNLITDKSLEKLVKLKSLDISSNERISYLQGLRFLKDLECLKLNWNKRISDEVTNLMSLKQIEFNVK